MSRFAGSQGAKDRHTEGPSMRLASLPAAWRDRVHGELPLATVIELDDVVVDRVAVLL